MRKAMLYASRSGRSLQCLLCSHYCKLKAGQTGKCGVRRNVDGVLYSFNADRVCALHGDPIEKKPLYHFLPGSVSLSVAAMGCNFKCSFCQNYSLSQVSGEEGIQGEAISPDEIVRQARSGGADSISYTYTEPTIFFELMYETARLARQEGIRNVMVTNGYYSPRALELIAPYLDAANIDLKAFTDEFYVRYCEARLQPVLQAIERTRKAGIWIELTTLLIPGLNDRDPERIIDFIREVDPDIPWHVSRFYPQYRELSRPPTDGTLIIESLRKAREKGLKFLYAGNMTDDRWENTYCPRCDSLLIERTGYHTRVRGLEKGTCRNCHAPIAGVWE